MNTVQGTIVVPDDVRPQEYGKVVIEVRDVTELDAPSEVVCSVELDGVDVRPGGRIPFAIEVPNVPRGRDFALRVHASQDGRPAVSRGDLLTTERIPISGETAVGSLVVRVRSV